MFAVVYFVPLIRIGTPAIAASGAAALPAAGADAELAPEEASLGWLLWCRAAKPPAAMSATAAAATSDLVTRDSASRDRPLERAVDLGSRLPSAPRMPSLP